MDKINSLIKSFLNSSSLSGLTKYEQRLYQLSCDGEIAKLQGKKNN